MASGAEYVIEKLSPPHEFGAFECGNPALNLWLKRFYLHFGFSPMVVDSLRLILLMKDLRALLKSKRH